MPQTIPAHAMRQWIKIANAAVTALEALGSDVRYNNDLSGVLGKLKYLQSELLEYAVADVAVETVVRIAA